MQAVNEKMWELIEPIVSGLGFTLVGMEYLKQGRFTVLRVFADSDNGINLDECANISRQIGAVLDVEEAITGAYNLEVSSPGVDRLIFRVQDFKLYINEDVNIRLSGPLNGRRKYKGKLLSVDDNNLVLLFNEEELEIPLDTIDKANLIGKIQSKKK